MNTTDTLDRPIRTLAQAEAVLAILRPSILDLPRCPRDAAFVIKPDPCPKCGGKGHLFGYEHVMGGVCFLCGGANTHNRQTRVDLKKAAQAAKAARTRDLKKVAEREREAAELLAKSSAFLDTRPALAAALATDHPILKDLAGSLRRWGSLSEKQMALALKIASDETNKPAEIEPPTGREEIEAVVLAIKPPHPDAMYPAWKLVLRVETPTGEYRLHGTLPSALDDEDVATGDRVRIRATIAPKEAGFGFFKRPTHAVIVARAQTA